MITANFKNIVRDILQKYSNYGAYPLKTTSNQTKYTVGSAPTPATLQVATTISNPGIFIGSGSTPPTENDYKLENMITSGFTGAVTYSHHMNEGVHSLVYDITITNTSDSPITISEVGYAVTVACASSIGSTSTSNATILYDRTVLPTPVTIAAGDFESIRYTLKTVDAA